MTPELAKVERRIYRVAVVLAGLMLRRAVLRADARGVAAHSARLDKVLAARHEYELQRAEEQGDCYFMAAADQDAEAILARGRAHG